MGLESDSTRLKETPAPCVVIILPGGRRCIRLLKGVTSSGDRCAIRFRAMVGPDKSTSSATFAASVEAATYMRPWPLLHVRDANDLARRSRHHPTILAGCIRKGSSGFAARVPGVISL